MTHAVYKNLFNLVFLGLLAGCASEPTSDPYEYTAKVISYPPAPVTQPDGQTAPQSAPGKTYSPSQNYSAQKVSGDYTHYAAVQNFIELMVQKYSFSRNYLYGLFSQAQRLDSVIRLESPVPSTGPKKPSLGSWTRYRNKFLTEQHISNGVEFWRNNAQFIQKASEAYGVDPEYIVGIIGVETYYGKNFGKTRIFDALTTLAFDTHRRGQYFATELENFLLMSREEGFEPREPVGSWAGAMGYGQFMPSSFRRLAVDFDHDGRRDIWNPHDAVGSVANYFSHSGWKFKNPVAQPAGRTNEGAVVQLSTYQGEEYWRVYGNFKVIKRYNNSDKYAMAVHQLAQAIKQRYSKS